MKTKYINTRPIKHDKANRNHLNFLLICMVTSILCAFGCKKFVDVSAPITTLSNTEVYNSDATAAAVLTGLYTNMSTDDAYGYPYTGNGLSMMGLYPSLSADELTLFSGSTNTALISYYKNALSSTNIGGTDFWAKTYKYLFTINSAISGISGSSALTPAVKTQLLGEAYFMRGFCYFYLVNLYGDVPLITSTDYSKTSLQPKSGEGQVYKQITSDLLQAQSLLNDNFLDGTLLKTSSERVRPNKGAATALLARAYLYTNNWENAELQATKIIENKTLYDLTTLNDVFLKNSTETIWAIQPVLTGTFANTGEGSLFVLPGTGPSSFPYQVYLSKEQLNSFETGDQRSTTWISSVLVSGIQYSYPFKYKIGAINTTTYEYPIVLRLAEQYLIRAEARIQEGNISGGIADVNILRERATDKTAPINNQLRQLLTTLSKEEALTAVMHERQVELFTEWGHRWFDLRRTKTIDSVMKIVTSQKGGVWDSHSALYPIPLYEIQTNINLTQTPGY